MASKKEEIIGWLLVALAVLGGAPLLNSYGTYWQLLLGSALGYIMSRSSIGFSSMIATTYKKGDPKMFLNVLLLLFVATMGSMAAVMFVPADWRLLIHPINGGLILGGILFGFGMTLTAFCSMTILMNVATNFPKALITLIFFGFGIWLGFPLEEKAALVTRTGLQSSPGRDGVYFPDFFASKTSGYVGGLAITAVLCLTFALVVTWHCRKKLSKERWGKVFSFHSEPIHPAPTIYERLFQSKWSLTVGAILLALVCSIMMWTTRGGWQAATPYGMWFGKGLVHIGVPPEQVAGYAQKSKEFFTRPLLSDANSVQNIGTLIGTMTYLLTSGQFVQKFKKGLTLKSHAVPGYAFGGIVMGLGTRLARGCNAGALFTPITNFSLSGWLVLTMIVIGGILGVHLKPYFKLIGE